MNTDNKPSSSKQDTSKISNKSSSNNVQSSKKAVNKKTNGSSKVEAELAVKVQDLKIDESVATKDTQNDSPRF